ncbi:GatB/YqeY domain-containing protein [Candidatus Woesebacteria bacterium]|nr:GatB/YqeY domain-containing protein [Candidatus Woesebacteria bacterium]MCD8506924.1 GatB/YqeY domain-containing protein [Candidatus Woesebacteria bacterium]MCD8527456.1 GatB/YqeY domain-containing protein [Candidatus Woesebacteria bacterium]MCD8546197.1 GatB/YqeY domain-containing protein [Candidatus Woesebacteria bacterium]
MTPVQRLTEDMKNAMRNKDKEALDAIRFLLSQVKNAEIDKPNREALTEEEFTKVVRKLVKNAEEAIQQYRDGDRPDLAEEEERKVTLWENYLPQQMSDEEVATIVDDVLANNPDQTQMGPIIGQVMARTQGRTDGGTVSRIVKEKLSA